MTNDDRWDAQSQTNRDASDASGNTEENDEAKTEEIKAGIEQTRTEMSHTIDAIQEKLSPQNIVDQAKESVREATIGRVEDMVNNFTYTARRESSSLMDTIKQNPLQAAVAGLSLGWLIMKSRSSSGNQSEYRYDNIRGNYTHGYGQGYDYNYNYEARNRGGYDYESQGQGGIGSWAKPNPVGRAGEKVGDVAGQVTQKAGDVVGQVGEKAGDLVGDVQHKAGDLAWQAQHQAQRAQGQFERMLRENPLAVGAAAVVLGAAIGLAVPETEQEHKLMGEARDTVMDRAKEVAGDAMDKVKRVTDEVQETVKEEAQRQGITQG